VERAPVSQTRQRPPLGCFPSSPHTESRRYLYFEFATDYFSFLLLDQELLFPLFCLKIFPFASSDFPPGPTLPPSVPTAITPPKLLFEMNSPTVPVRCLFQQPSSPSIPVLNGTRTILTLPSCPHETGEVTRPLVLPVFFWSSPTSPSLFLAISQTPTEPVLFSKRRGFDTFSPWPGSPRRLGETYLFPSPEPFSPLFSTSSGAVLSCLSFNTRKLRRDPGPFGPRPEKSSPPPSSLFRLCSWLSSKRP